MALLAITIADTDALPYIELRSLSIQERAAGQGSALTCTAYIPASALGGAFFKPKPGQVIEVEVNDTRVFKGPILTTTDSWVNPEVMRVDIDAQDWTFFLNRRLVVKQEYPAQKAGERIRSILDEFLSGEGFFISDDDVEASLEVPAQGYDYVEVTSAFDELAEATGFHWYADFDKQIHLIAETDDVSPLDADYNNILDLDTNLEVGDVVVTEDVSGLHNTIVVKDFQERSSYAREDTFVADGEQTFFPLYMEPFSLDDIRVWVKKYGTDEWVEREVELDPLDGSPDSITGVPGRAYVCLFNVGLRFPTSDLPGKGDTIKAEYKYVLEPRIFVVEDEDSQTEMARREKHLEGGVEQSTSGVHEAVISLPDFRVSSLDPVEFFGELTLDREAWPLVTGSFTTFLDGWRAGQYFKITSSNRDIFDIPTWVKSSGYPDDGTKDPLPVWVTGVTKAIVAQETGGYRIRSEVEFSSQPFAR